MTRATRMIRARDLVKGATVIYGCNAYCPFRSEHETAPRGQGDHLLTLLDVEPHGGGISAIVVTESGEQDVLAYCFGGTPVRVVADSMPLADAPTEG